MSLRLQILPIPAPARRCRVCGCTDDRACPGGCWWVSWDLCSSCRDDAYRDSTPVDLGPRPEGFVAASCLKCRRPVLVGNEFRPPIAFDPVQHDKGRSQGYLFTHDCPEADDWDGDDWDLDPGEYFEDGV